MFAFAGTCAYGSGGVATHSCNNPGTQFATPDGLLPYSCSKFVIAGRAGGTETVLTTSVKTPYGVTYFAQCTDYVRRALAVRGVAVPPDLKGSACAWWDAALKLPPSSGIGVFQNGVSEGAFAARSAPEGLDLVIFKNVVAGKAVCGGNHDGHVALVGHADQARGKVVLAEQNVNAEPREINLLEDAGTWTIAPPSATSVVAGWVRMPRVATCGLRAAAVIGDSVVERLATCTAGNYCDLDLTACEPLGPRSGCTSDGQCPAGTRCDGRACVCDDALSIADTSLDLSRSIACWRPGPFIRNADGCSATLALGTTPSGSRALYLRDFVSSSAVLLSPPLRWTAAVTKRIEVDLSCRALPSDARLQLTLARTMTEPVFDVALPDAALSCDGANHMIAVPLTTALPANASIGRLQLTIASASGQQVSGGEMWIRAVRLTDALTAGRIWEVSNLGASENLTSIWGSSTGDVYIASGSGAVFAGGPYGTAWRRHQVSASGLNSVHGWATGSVWVAGGNGEIAQTRNGGASWTTIAPPSTAHFWAAFANNEADALIGGVGGLWRTGNAGASWLRPTAPTDDTLSSLARWGSTTFATTFSGSIWRSSDDASTFNSVYTQHNIPIERVWSPESGVLFAVGAAGTVLRSRDDGITWTALPSRTALTLYGIWGMSADDVFAAGASGAVLHSADEGESWSAPEGLPDLSTSTLRAVWGAGACDVYFVGDGGVVLHGRC